ncbi:MAG TPA: molybdenum cofactor guanylyltransferase [Candidatus Eisenbacteria bacterium]|nr:molybdenum cofactor guanylyltransferase [Candidatus Eisenbacteria bacterium]
MRVSAIVLAGGRSSRFGGSKLQALVDGVPLLDLAIRAAAEVADEVIVVGPASGGVALTDLDGLPAAVRVELVRDPVAFGGPLIGLRSGLGAATGVLAIVVGGDMPRLEPAVLRAMLARLGDLEPAAPRSRNHAPIPGGRGASAPESPGRPGTPGSPGLPDGVLLGQPGGARPLPVALCVTEARRAVEAAIASEETSLRAALARLNVAEIPEDEWGRLDPAGGSLLDVDTQADLEAARRL